MIDDSKNFVPSCIKKVNWIMGNAVVVTVVHSYISASIYKTTEEHVDVEVIV